MTAATQVRPHTVDGVPCEHTWPSDTPSRAEGTYRQHRCVRRAQPGHRHVCRYCAATKET